MRAVLDTNILVSAVISRGGAPAEVLKRWLEGEFELVVSELLLDELARVLAYPKLRARVPADDAAEFLLLLRRSAIVAVDPPEPPARSSDPNDDCRLALAEVERAVLVSGDQHVLERSGQFPIHTARSFLDTLQP